MSESQTLEYNDFQTAAPTMPHVESGLTESELPYQPFAFDPLGDDVLGISLVQTTASGTPGTQDGDVFAALERWSVSKLQRLAELPFEILDRWLDEDAIEALWHVLVAARKIAGFQGVVLEPKVDIEGGWRTVFVRIRLNESATDEMLDAAEAKFDDLLPIVSKIDNPQIVLSLVW